MSVNGLLMKGVSAVLADDSFTLSSSPARNTRETADRIAKWIPSHQEVATAFEKKLVDSLSKCLQVQRSSRKVSRERMWSSYHSLRTSDSYLAEWRAFLQRSGSSMSPIFCQYVGHHVFQQLIKLQYPLTDPSEAAKTSRSALTYEEINALRYAAGYVPRVLKKKLLKSAHPLKEDLQLCLLDLLDDGDEDSNESRDWVELINRGGLTRVNNNTFEVFVAMEYALRRHLNVDQVPNLTDHVNSAIIENEDVQFLWSILSSDWDEETGSILLEMVVSQWVKIRGFSVASAWVERYKCTQKKTTQKSKGVRKQLLPKPKSKAKTDSTAPQENSDPE